MFRDTLLRCRGQEVNFLNLAPPVSRPCFQCGIQQLESCKNTIWDNILYIDVYHSISMASKPTYHVYEPSNTHNLHARSCSSCLKAAFWASVRSGVWVFQASPNSSRFRVLRDKPPVAFIGSHANKKALVVFSLFIYDLFRLVADWKPYSSNTFLMYIYNIDYTYIFIQIHVCRLGIKFGSDWLIFFLSLQPQTYFLWWVSYPNFN